MFDPKIVNRAINIFSTFGTENKLGKPLHIITCDEPLGLGVEFANEKRSAVAFRGELASENFAESKRRVEEWIAA